MENIVKILGTFGSIILLFCLFPQIYRLYKTKHAGEISLLWLIMTKTGLICLIIYGFYFELYDITIPICLQLIGFTIILILKIHYDRINPEEFDSSINP